MSYLQPRPNTDTDTGTTNRGSTRTTALNAAGAGARTRRKEARPNEIVDAALAEFVDKGFAGASVQAIAKRAGVSKGTVFVYFETKEDLFKAVVRANIAAPLNTWRDETRDYHGSTRDLVVHSMHQWWTDVGSTPAAGICKLLLQEAVNFPEIAAFYQEEVIEPGMLHMRAILQRGVDRGEFKTTDLDTTGMNVFSPLLFLAMWQQAMGTDKPICGPAIDAREFIDNHARLMLDGICHTPAQATPPTAQATNSTANNGMLGRS
ncbi:MAG: TetR/AcrR family transcriptional regulator [Burkholderiaceae bacterium]|jgi:TetR/AcrR family transcriptional regulator|nr:TetR/AcrR family transcriptional regulator [Burkholderiaceae bacterium]